ncbi:hypothetical protein LCGC14_1121410 [marine sediment metagenome]|uniref:Uncharacterized protein n=1 Tax=marine sediment metagenome TaxID=412755 RepID=A0A0F9MRK9_9ZZZZ
MKIRVKPGDLVEILWDDAGAYGRWRDPDTEFPDDNMRCRTVGYFHSENKRSIVVRQSEAFDYDYEVRQASDFFQIPKACIKKFARRDKGLHWPKEK